MKLHQWQHLLSAHWSQQQLPCSQLLLVMQCLLCICGSVAQHAIGVLFTRLVSCSCAVLHAALPCHSNCSNLRMCQLSPQEACGFLAAQQNSPHFSAMVAHLASGPVVAMELMAASGVRKLLDILGELQANQQQPWQLQCMVW